MKKKVYEKPDIEIVRTVTEFSILAVSWDPGDGNLPIKDGDGSGEWKPGEGKLQEDLNAKPFGEYTEEY